MKQIRFLIVLTCLACINGRALAQATQDEVYSVYDVAPQFPGGQDAMMKFLANNLIYPDIAKEENQQGTIYITFIVEKDGSLSGIKILRGVSAALDEEALRVVKKMPKWKPGKVAGQIVRCQYNLPIKFKLSD